MAELVRQIRAAARASRCPIADTLADVELDLLICTLLEAQIAIGWKMLPPGMSFQVVMVSDVAGNG
jgi:hypothetical protein